jgi:hypothetical protein
VPGDGGLLGALTSDPLVLYPALAALVLASVSLATGLLRGDVLALARPVPVGWLLALLAATWGFAVSAAAAPAPWHDVILGAGRFPLYLFALAYGSVPALVAAALVAAWVPLQHAGAWGPWLFGLEVVVIGWLAVWPSPRLSRATGPLYALLAYTLAWGTAGLAAVVLEQGAVGVDTLRAQHGLVPAGVLAAAALLLLVAPTTYVRAFPDSRITPSAGTRPDRRGRPPGAPEVRHARPDLAPVPVPPPLQRTRGERRIKRETPDGPAGR